LPLDEFFPPYGFVCRWAVFYLSCSQQSFFN